MRARHLLVLSSVFALGGVASGCDEKKAESTEDANGGLSKLDATQERRVSAIDTSQALLNPSLADALVGLPRDHGPRVVQLAYPEATIRKNNPRVNTLFRVRGAGALDSLDIRWSRVRKHLIGSVVFTYRREVDVAALGALVQAVAKPVEGEKGRWLVEGGRLGVTFIPQNMEGETVVAFDRAALEGGPIGGDADDMKQATEWGLKGQQRARRMKAGQRRSESEASGSEGRAAAADGANGPAPTADEPATAEDEPSPAPKEPAPAARPAAEPEEDLLKALDDI